MPLFAHYSREFGTGNRAQASRPRRAGCVDPAVIPAPFEATGRLLHAGLGDLELERSEIRERTVHTAMRLPDFAFARTRAHAPSGLQASRRNAHRLLRPTAVVYSAFTPALATTTFRSEASFRIAAANSAGG